jgi:AcrR family transcriptional regulator
MLDGGYAAVSTRRVAKEIGLTPALVHYYFPTTDDLFVAVYRRAAEKTTEQVRQAIRSDHPVRALWRVSNDPACTALAMEFMAMANHRKAIRAEIACSIEKFRRLQADALAQLPTEQRSDMPDPLGLTVLMAGISRLLVTERFLGVELGHHQARHIVGEWVRRLEAPTSSPVPRRPVRKARSATA